MTTFSSEDIKQLYKAEGRIPYAVEEAISKYKKWRLITINPNKIDSHIDQYAFEGKSEKPRFDRMVRAIKTGKDINPILIENTIQPAHAHQVEGATFEEPIDGYARLAAHKKANIPIKVLVPERVAKRISAKHTSKRKPTQRVRTKKPSMSISGSRRQE